MKTRHPQWDKHGNRLTDKEVSHGPGASPEPFMTMYLDGSSRRYPRKQKDVGFLGGQGGGGKFRLQLRDY